MVLSHHPDFRVRDSVQISAGGLSLSHTLHLAEVEKASGSGCDACHHRSADDAYFAPIEFDRDCASCHVKNDVLVNLGMPANRPHRDPATLARVASLGQVVDPGARERERAAAARELDSLETARRRSGVAAAAVRPGTPLVVEWETLGIPVIVPKRSVLGIAEDKAIGELRTHLDARIRELDAEVGPPIGLLTAVQANAELTELLAPCLVCHERDRARLRPVTAARPVMTTSAFSHAPHLRLTEVACETCHDRIARSGFAMDVNLPTVATCQTCHGVRPDAPLRCVSCHTYHRPPMVPHDRR